jgi:hypothetical protein
MWQGGINHPALRDKWGQAWTEWDAMRVFVRVVEGGSFVPRLGEAQAIEPWQPSDPSERRLFEQLDLPGTGWPISARLRDASRGDSG